MPELLAEIREAFRSRDRHRFTIHGAHEATADDFSVDDVRDAIIEREG